MKRALKDILIERINGERACALIGPRQVGKSFLLQEIIQEFGGNYLSLDDPIVRAEVEKDPLAYLRNFHHEDKFLFIDEPAKVPLIFDAIKVLIDEQKGRPSKICIANSGNYHLLKRVKESLAGRISMMSLLPFSWRELQSGNNALGLLQLIEAEEQKLITSKNVDHIQINRSRERTLSWGGYPVPTLSSDNDFRIRWIKDYLTTYVLPIMIEQFQIRNLGAFEKFARLVFINSGKILNKNSLAKTVGVSQPTIDNFLYQLKAMMLVVTLEIYHRNPKKRLVKQNKVHAIDTLLLHNALNTDFSNERAKELQVFGNIYESFICVEVLKTLFNAGSAFDAYYWRTQDGAEVDVVLELKGKVLPLEIKATSHLNTRDASGLMSFLADNPHVKKGYIVYPGREVQQINSKVVAIPDWWLLGC